MSYARWGGKDGSEVYVYHSTSGVWWCCGCPRIPDNVKCATALEMAEHLELDRAAGFVVPQRAIDELRAEKADAHDRE